MTPAKNSLSPTSTIDKLLLPPLSCSPPAVTCTNIVSTSLQTNTRPTVRSGMNENRDFSPLGPPVLWSIVIFCIAVSGTLHIYYCVSRPLSGVKFEQTTGSAAAGNDVDRGQALESHEEDTAVSGSSAPSRITALDFLASAAEAAQTSFSYLSLTGVGGIKMEGPLLA